MIDFEVPYGEKCPNYDDITASRGTCGNCKHVKQALHTFAFCKEKKESESENIFHPLVHGDIDLYFNTRFLNLSDKEKKEYISRVKECIYKALDEEMDRCSYMGGFQIKL